MRAWFENIVGPDYAGLAVWLTAVAAMAILLYAFYRISRRYASGTYVAGGRNRKTRLAVVDAAAIDGHRRLVLVRRDDVEHLVMIGGPTDIVVEQHIRVVPRAIRPADPEPPAAEARPAPATTPSAPVAHVSEPLAREPERRPSPSVSVPMPEPRPPEAPITPPGPVQPTEPHRQSPRALTLPPLRPSPVVMATPQPELVRATPPPLPPVTPRQVHSPERPRPVNPAENRAPPPMPERATVPYAAPPIASAEPVAAISPLAAAVPIAAAAPIMAAPPIAALSDAVAAPIQPQIDEDDIALDDALLQELELTLEGAVETDDRTGERIDDESSLEEEMTRLLGGLAPTRN